MPHSNNNDNKLKAIAVMVASAVLIAGIKQLHKGVEEMEIDTLTNPQKLQDDAAMQIFRIKVPLVPCEHMELDKARVRYTRSWKDRTFFSARCAPNRRSVSAELSPPTLETCRIAVKIDVLAVQGGVQRGL